MCSESVKCMSAVSGARIIGFAPTSILLAHRAPARELEPTMRWTWDSVFHAAIKGAGELGLLASFMVGQDGMPRRDKRDVFGKMQSRIRGA